MYRRRYVILFLNEYIEIEKAPDMLSDAHFLGFNVQFSDINGCYFFLLRVM